MKGKSSRVQTMITPSQVKLIHTLKTAIGMDDDHYRCALYEGFRVESCKELTLDQAEDLLRDFKTRAVSLGVWTGKSRTKRTKDLRPRDGFASPSQLSYIEGLWEDVSRVTEENRRRALRGFLMRQAGVSDLRFLTADKANAVICALKQMKARQMIDAALGSGDE